MRVLLLEDAADGLLDLALRAQEYGHQVLYHLSKFDRWKHPTGMGLVERSADWRQHARWADIIICGGNGKWIRELDVLRKEGRPVIGGCQEVANLELDRLAGMAAFKKVGIPIPPFRHCRNLKEAMEYVADRDEGCAVKPSGDIADKSTSVVGKTAKEVLWRLSRWQKEGKSFPSGLIVQDRVVGAEFAVGGWIGPGGFAPLWEENFEEKRPFSGSMGPNTGEAGTVMRLVRKSRLADKVLSPLEDRLVELGYVGNIDCNTIVNPDGDALPLEFTTRFGWPAWNIELALHDNDPIEWLYGLCEGKPPKTRVADKIAVGIVLAIPPYPNSGAKTDEIVNVPIWGVTPSIEDNLHFVDVMRGTDSDLATSGEYVLVGTGTGDTVVAARREAERVLNRLTIPQPPYYRNDIGARLRKDLPALQAHGFATGISYA